jgi:hypothetical protein
MRIGVVVLSLMDAGDPTEPCLRSLHGALSTDGRHVPLDDLVGGLGSDLVAEAWGSRQRGCHHSATEKEPNGCSDSA